MILGLAQSLFRLLRENSDIVPVARLKRQGVKSVTVLDWDRVDKLITQAVEETLARRGITLSREARRSVDQEALETFHRLVEQRDRLAESARSLAQEKADLQENLATLRAELTRSQEELGVEQERRITVDDVAIDGERFEAYAERLSAELARLAAGDAPSTSLPESVALAARRLVDEERQRALADAKEAQAQRVQQLERRIHKLQGTLEHSEDVIKRLRRGEAGDVGVESIYRSVQGLDDKDSKYQAKRGVLDEIFKLNVSLKEVIEREGRR